MPAAAVASTASTKSRDHQPHGRPRRLNSIVILLKHNGVPRVSRVPDGPRPDVARRGRMDANLNKNKAQQAPRKSFQGRGPIMAISLKVNGASHSTPAEPDTPLLYVLRNDLFLAGAKFGCGLAQCGACTVLVDGKATRSCVTPIGTLGNAEITTIEGLGTVEKPHPLQQAFIDEQAAQCGYCINGMIMKAKELLDQKPQPTEADVREALAGHLCRCGTHNRIVAAVVRAGKQMGRT